MKPKNCTQMQIDQKNIIKIIQTIEKTHIVQVFCSKDLGSICALSILTEILKKELLKYEVTFARLKDGHCLALTIDGQEYTLACDAEGLCGCPRREIVGAAIVYSTAKAMGLTTIRTVWPLAVAFSFYRGLVLPAAAGTAAEDAQSRAKENVGNKATDKKDQAAASQMCKWCTELHADLVVQTKTLACKIDGVFYKKRNALSFLHSSTLFLAIKNDLGLVFTKRLFSNKNGDRRIHELLALAGISISTANEPYTNVGGATKAVVDATFGEREAFVLRSGHDLEISALEHALLIHFYLYKEKSLYALLSLGQRKLISPANSCRFYQNTMHLFKEAVLSQQKAGGIAVFQIKGIACMHDGAEAVFVLLDYLFCAYMRNRLGAAGRRLILSSAEDRQSMVVYSEDPSLAQAAGLIKERRSSCMVVIATADLNALLRQLAKDK